jgi:hypothetical protein
LDDRTWPSQFRTHRLNSVSGRARSSPHLIHATRPQLPVSSLQQYIKKFTLHYNQRDNAEKWRYGSHIRLENDHL